LDVNCHSQPSCIKKIDNITCVGFPRYYHFNYLADALPSSDSINKFYASRDREYLIQPGVNKICPELPLDEYTDKFPMAQASPGETITLQHPPRGHSTQPSSDVWIYMYPTPNMFPGNKQLNSSEFKLIGQYPYNNCVGVTQEISWANCTGTITLPQNLTTGIYTFWWRWDLNQIPYSDCFEINIGNNTIITTDNTTTLPNNTTTLPNNTTTVTVTTTKVIYTTLANSDKQPQPTHFKGDGHDHSDDNY
jgi:hypothetical protein